MRTLLLAALPLTLWAQTLNINLDHLAPKASERSEVTLEGDLLEAIKKMQPEMAEKLKDITRVYIRSFAFARPGEYTEADLENIRGQATGTGWSKVLSVKEQNESTDISVYSEGGQIRGLLILAAEPTELSVIHIGGRIDMARMQEVVASTVSFDLDSINALQGQ